MNGFEVYDLQHGKIVASFPLATSFKIEGWNVTFNNADGVAGAVVIDINRVIRKIESSKTANAS
jgi:hypothetical protein